jgi:hypothetical protein
MGNTRELQTTIPVVAIPAAVTADPGTLSIQNIGGTLKQVDDQGNATSIGGGGSLSLPANTIAGNNTGGTASATGLTPAQIQTMLSVQPSSAVAITGGTITGVNTATRSAQGAESSADKAFSDDYDQFRKSAYATMIAAVPALTGFKSWDEPFNFLTSTSAMTGDANYEGGGLTCNGTVQLFGGSTFQNTAGGNWAIFFEGKVVIPTSGVLVQLGLSNAAGSDAVWIGSANSVDATHYMFRIKTGGGNTTVTGSASADTSRHIFGLTDNGTTITGWVDGVSIGTTTTRTFLTTEAMIPFIYSDASGHGIVSRLAIGFVK